MSIKDFLCIARYGNENWKGCFSERELMENATDYKAEYDYSIAQGKPTPVICALCELLYTDMHINMPSNFNVRNMKGILKDATIAIQMQLL